MKKLWGKLPEGFRKGLISLLRNAVLGAIGVILSGLIDLIPTLDLGPTETFLVVGFIKLIDETLHKTGVAVRGIARF